MAADDIRAMSEALAAEPSSLVFLPLGEALLARGEYSHAQRVAQRGAARHASRADAHDLVARIALAQGDTERAQAAWETVLTLAPHFGTAHRGLGFIHHRAGRPEHALAHLEAALAEDPRDESVLAAIAAVRAAMTEEAATALATEPAAGAPAEPAPAAADGSLMSSTSDQPQGRPEPRSSAAQADPATVFDEILGDTAQVALLLESDGVVAAGRYETAEGTDLGAIIGAHLSGVSDEAERAMRHFGLGRWTRLVIESEAAVVAMAPAGAAAGGSLGAPVVLVAAPREMPLGFARRTLDRCIVAARAWLGQMEDQ
ncbi:MAG: tetratricopeptide repeat protein [Gemmatimonadaceae bacterium]